MYIYDILEKKRAGKALTDEEIREVVKAYVADEITDAQMSALLMAICINGMTTEETIALTKAMQASGKTYKYDFKSVDKHSTGGVGDSTSLILVPTLAALGLKVTKMSGKSLGFTGGTIDKLKAFDGYNPEMSEKKYLDIVKSCGGVIISQSSDIALADKKIYALRDKTATVESIPLIASSIMSKKLSCGADSILLDVKYGSGALVKSVFDAGRLARLMVKIGKKAGKKVNAVITNMNTPLSYGVGCNMEVYCAIMALHGKNSQLLELSKYLSAKLHAMHTGASYKKAYSLVSKAISSGASLNKMREIISLGGGDVSILDKPEKLLVSDYVVKVIADKSGYINNIDALKVAKFVNHLKDSVDTDKQKLRTGVMFNYAVGDKVNKGDELATVYSASKVTPAQLKELTDAVAVNKYKLPLFKLVVEAIK